RRLTPPTAGPKVSLSPRPTRPSKVDETLLGGCLLRGPGRGRLTLGPTGHRDEQGRLERPLSELAAVLLDQVDDLIEPSPQGDDHPAAVLELVDQRLGDLLRGAGDDDGIERSGFRPALVAVADPRMDVVIAQLLVDLGRAFAE